MKRYNTITIVPLLFLVFFLPGCEEVKQLPNATQCVPPSIFVGGECCPDINNNSICDGLERPEANISEEVLVPQPVKPSINITFLEESIKKAYPRQRYNFTDPERENLTDIENTFDISRADRFDILKIKKGYNFLETETQFADFMKRLYSVNEKNLRIWASEKIDFERLRNEDWREMSYDDTHSLTMEGDFFLEEHIVWFHRLGDLYRGYFDYSFVVWCTPELVVRVYVPEYKLTTFSGGGPIEGAKKIIKDKETEFKGEMLDVARNVAAICAGKEVGPLSSNHDVVFYGRDGFIPNEIRIKAGETVVFHNENTQWYRMILTFVREKPTRKIFNSNITEIGESIEIQFNETGNYTFFMVQYNPKGKLIVEPVNVSES